MQNYEKNLELTVYYLPYLPGYGSVWQILQPEVVLHHERKHGVSKFGLERYARGFFDLLTVVFITNYINRPMHLFGGIGSLFFIAGLVIFSYLFFGRWIFGESIGASPLFSIAIFLIGSGVQIFIIGMLSELIVHNKEREKKKSYSIKTMNIENR